MGAISWAKVAAADKVENANVITATPTNLISVCYTDSRAQPLETGCPLLASIDESRIRDEGKAHAVQCVVRVLLDLLPADCANIGQKRLRHTGAARNHREAHDGEAEEEAGRETSQRA